MLYVYVFSGRIGWHEDQRAGGWHLVCVCVCAWGSFLAKGGGGDGRVVDDSIGTSLFPLVGVEDTLALQNNLGWRCVSEVLLVLVK